MPRSLIPGLLLLLAGDVAVAMPGNQAIGRVSRQTPAEWNLHLRDDNHNPKLPRVFRSWWQTRLEGVSTSGPTRIRLTGRGHKGLYLPVYSYDYRNWRQLPESAVRENGRGSLVMTTRFRRSRVWLARQQPYTMKDLRAFLDRTRTSPFARIQSIGRTRAGRDMPLLTLTNFRYGARHQRRIWIHARTHPGETSTSWVVEGLVDWLLTSAAGQRSLKYFIFNILPMHNLDGVALGNNRTTPASVDLERAWCTRPDRPGELCPDAPLEVRNVHRVLRAFMAGKTPVRIALNLHSTNGSPQMRPHFIPHFGDTRQYNARQRSLFRKQRRFVRFFLESQPRPWVRDLAEEHGPSFAGRPFMETWFWKNYGPAVMAVTFESTYGRIPGTSSWFNPEEYRRMGAALARSSILWFAKRPPRKPGPGLMAVLSPEESPH